MKVINVLVVGGEYIIKDLLIGFCILIEDVENIKIKYGYVFYDYVFEEEVFSVLIIGSD